MSIELQIFFEIFSWSGPWGGFRFHFGSTKGGRVEKSSFPGAWAVAVLLFVRFSLRREQIAA